MNFTTVGIQMAAHFMSVTKFASTFFTLILIQEGYNDHKHANINHFFKVKSDLFRVLRTPVFFKAYLGLTMKDTLNA